MQRFVALKDFTAVVNGRKNSYRKGYDYTARDGEVWKELRELLPTWVKEGKVELVNKRKRPATGAGIVRTKQE